MALWMVHSSALHLQAHSLLHVNLLGGEKNAYVYLCDCVGDWGGG
jgi:hypothetical protein